MNLFTVLRILFFAPPPPGTLPKCSRFDGREIEKCTDLLVELAFYTGRLNEELVDSRRQLSIKSVRGGLEDVFGSSNLRHNISQQCDKALECYAPIQCQEIHSQMQELKDLCLYHKVRYFQPCLSEFFKKAILGSNEFPCLEKHDFMAKNLTKQNEAYTQGKECFLIFVNQRCNKHVQKFFTGNYEYFVEKMTIEPENNTCDSFHEHLIQTRCLYIFEKELELTRDVKDDAQKNDAVKLCRYLQTCNNEKCYASVPDRGLFNKCDLLEML